MKIFVGNLSFDTTEDTLRSLFEDKGAVDEVAIVTDRATGRPRGFAFVTMANHNEARAAIETLNGVELDGRKLNISEARPKTESRREGGGGGGGGYGGGGRGGRGGRGGGGGDRW
jgi:cold-inducible RNA-binding protein